MLFYKVTSGLVIYIHIAIWQRTIFKSKDSFNYDVLTSCNKLTESWNNNYGLHRLWGDNNHYLNDSAGQNNCSVLVIIHLNHHFLHVGTNRLSAGWKLSHLKGTGGHKVQTHWSLVASILISLTVFLFLSVAINSESFFHPIGTKRSYDQPYRGGSHTSGAIGAAPQLFTLSSLMAKHRGVKKASKKTDLPRFPSVPSEREPSFFYNQMARLGFLTFLKLKEGGEMCTARWTHCYTNCISIVFAAHTCMWHFESGHCWWVPTAVPLLSTVSARKAHIPAAVSSEVQGNLGGHAAGCLAPLCLFY